MALTRITKGVIKPNENYDTHNINSTGIVTAVGANFTGDVNVGGVLTYEDVTSIDSVGIITAQKGIHIGAGVSAVGVGTFGSLDIGGDIDVDGHTNLDNVSVAGVSTFASNVIVNGGISNAQYLNLSALAPSIDFNDTNDNSDFMLQNANGLFKLYDNTNTADRVTVASDGKVSVKQDLDVDGHTNLDNVSVAGVTTFATTVHLNTSSDSGASRLLNIAHATASSPLMRIANTHASGRKAQIEYHNTQSTFVQGIRQGSTHDFITFSINPRPISFWNSSTERLRIESSGNISIFKDLDVDGHTNLDNVSVAGLTTFSGDIRTHNIFPSGSNRDIGSVANPFRDIHLSNDLSLIDNGLLKLGDNNELLIQHSGSNNFIEGGSGFSGNLYLRAKLNQEGVSIESDGAVTLNHSGSAKLVTSSGGVGVTGDITVSGNVDGVDIAALNTTVGTKLANVVEDTSPQLGGDLYSNGRHIRMDNTKYVYLGTDGFGIAGYALNQVYFEGNSTGQTIYIRPKLNQESIKAVPNGSVALHYSGNKKLETASNGVTVTGTLAATALTGDGSGITGITQTTINSNTNNYVITGTGTADTLQGESGLTFDGSNLTVGAGYISVRKPTLPQVDIQHSTTNSYCRLYMSQTSGGGGYFAINKLGTVDAGYTGGANAVQLWSSVNAPMLFATNNNERLRIKGNGQVIIGNVSNTGGNTNSALLIEQAGMSIASNYDFDDVSGSAPHLTLSGQSTRVRLDFGTMNGAPYGAWIQARYDNNPFGNSGTDKGREPLALNPKGGVVTFNLYNSNATNEIGGGGAGSQGGIVMRAGRANSTVVNNASTAIKIFPGEQRAYSGSGAVGEQNEGTKYGGIAWNILDPHHSNWGTNHDGHHCWMGMSLHSTPAQEKSNWQVQMNNDAGAGTYASIVAIQANPEGYVTTPNQPSFCCIKNSSSFSFSNGQRTVITGWSEHHDTHNDFDPTSGVFTAPVKGTYFFYVSVMQDRNDNGDFQISIFKNTSMYVNSNDMTSTGVTYQQTTVNGIVNCDKNDTIDFRAYNGSGTSSYIYQNSYTHCGGYLIG